MIRIACPGCGSQLNAKDELAGQKRKCPKCGGEILVPSAVPADAAPVDSSLAATSEAPAGRSSNQPSESQAAPLPRRLDRRHRYLICDSARVVAQWENNGSGWMLRTKNGVINAARNRSQLPGQGEFRLVDLQLVATEAGLRLTGIAVDRLAPFGAMPNLARGDDAILTSIVGPGSLASAAKSAVRQLIREQFMPDVWAKSDEVFDYLASDR